MAHIFPTKDVYVIVKSTICQCLYDEEV